MRPLTGSREASELAVTSPITSIPTKHAHEQSNLPYKAERTSDIHRYQGQNGRSVNFERECLDPGESDSGS